MRLEAPSERVREARSRVDDLLREAMTSELVDERARVAWLRSKVLRDAHAEVRAALPACENRLDGPGARACGGVAIWEHPGRLYRGRSIRLCGTCASAVPLRRRVALPHAKAWRALVELVLAASNVATMTTAASRGAARRRNAR